MPNVIPLWYSNLCWNIYARGGNMTLLINYFLISLPEMAAITILTLVLYGVELKKRVVRLSIYIVASALLTFLGEQLFGASSIKPLLLTGILILIFYFALRVKFQYAIIIVLSSTVPLGIFQSIVVFAFVFGLQISIHDLLQSLKWKVSIGVVSDGLFLLLAYVMAKKQWQLKLSRIER
jgi:hypothetical protein